MDEFRKNTEQDASEQTTPFQTPVRGADEQPVRGGFGPDRPDGAGDGAGGQ